MAPSVTKVRDPNPKTGTSQTTMTSEGDRGEKAKAVLLGPLHLLQVLDLDDAGMIALPTSRAVREEPACEDLVRC